jgi:2-polyprenyl-3-methyl-5-hydroxy-6-metoxy-1,4-benzoquinol methylase
MPIRHVKFASLLRRGRRAANLVKRWVSRVLPYRPAEGGKQRFDAEYASGQWNYLRSTSELPRFGIVAAYCQHYGDGGALLDIGCGEGLLRERLCHTAFSQYVGVDLSEEAIRLAAKIADEKTQFYVADASHFVPTGSFDVIVFNEILNYFDDPLSVVSRYEEFLADTGVIVVSMFHTIDCARENMIWRSLSTRYKPTASARVTTRRDYTWTIKVLKPLRSYP